MRETRTNRRVNSAFVAAAIAHLGSGYDTAEGRQWAVNNWEMFSAQRARLEMQGDRSIPEEGAIAHCPELGRAPWIHIALFGDANGNARVEIVQTPTEDRPDTVLCCGLTFIRWIDSREVGPIGGEFEEF